MGTAPTAALRIAVRTVAFALVAVLLLTLLPATPENADPGADTIELNASVTPATGPATDTGSRTAQLLGSLPLSFEPLPDGSFRSRGAGYALAVDGSGLKLRAGGQAVDLRFAGAAAVEGAGERPLAGKINYLLGKDSSSWRTDVPTYAAVRYPAIYPGIDLVWHGQGQRAEYDFVVSPGADPSPIALAVPSGTRIDQTGALLLPAGADHLRLEAPVAYQDTGAGRVTVPAAFALDDGHARFTLGRYDPALTLVIDPVLTWSTYLGGGGNDEARAITIGADGAVYVAGFTDSTNFPTVDPFQGAYGDSDPDSDGDAFVAKLTADGSALVYATYLGGVDADAAVGIAVDAGGAVYVAGYTLSTNFPTENPFEPAHAGGLDAFVAKLNPAGSALVYSTYLGGGSSDIVWGLAVDTDGAAYVAGTTESNDFPTTAGALPFALVGGREGFVFKLNPAGSLEYSTYLGGNGFDEVRAIAVDTDGAAHVAGWTFSTDFPLVSEIQSAKSTGNDAFVAKLNPAGSALVYSTYLGGSGNNDIATGIAVDASGAAYVTGQTNSADFPTTVGAIQDTYATNTDVFVVKLTANGSAFMYATYLGGNGSDVANGIAVDASGAAYVTGDTTSMNFPITVDAIQSAKAASNDVFVAKLNPAGSALVYSTYLGGSGADLARAIAVDANGAAYVTGRTGSTNFPTESPLQPASGGPADAFIFKLSKLPQAITFGALADRTLDQSPFGVSATADSTLPVSFSSLTAPVCTVAGTSVTLVSTGTCTIRADQAGDASYAPASSVDRSFAVSAAPPPPAPPPPAPPARPVTLVPTSPGVPLVSTQPVLLPADGVVRSDLTLTGPPGSLLIEGDTRVTSGGAPFGGMLHPPVPVEVTGFGGGVVLRTVSTGGGAGAIAFDPPAALRLPLPAGADPTDYQPVALDPLRYLDAVVENGAFVIRVDALSAEARFVLARVPSLPAVAYERPLLREPAYAARWAGQSPAAVLAPGQEADLTVLLRNTGDLAWTKGPAPVLLATSAPPGNTRDADAGLLPHPLYNGNRLAGHAEPVVAPGAFGTFTVRVRGTAPGTHRIFVRPVVEGVDWLADEGIHLEVVVR